MNTKLQDAIATWRALPLRRRRRVLQFLAFEVKEQRAVAAWGRVLARQDLPHHARWLDDAKDAEEWAEENQRVLAILRAIGRRR